MPARPARTSRRPSTWTALTGREMIRGVGQGEASVSRAGRKKPPGRIWRPRHEPWPDPDSIETSEAGSPDHAGWWFRVVRGGFGTGQHTRIWTKETTRL